MEKEEDCWEWEMASRDCRVGVGVLAREMVARGEVRDKGCTRKTIAVHKTNTCHEFYGSDVSYVHLT